jgi:C1q domain
MSTLSLRKIKHDSSSVDNITLDSSGNITTNGNIRVNNSSTGGYISLYTANNGNYGFIRNNSTTSSNSIEIGANGPMIKLDDSYSTYIQFWNGSSIVTGAKFDGNGRLTMPYQPNFAAGFSGAPTIADNAVCVFDSVRINRGSHYNSSNGRFTAPIYGVYYFQYSNNLSRSGSWNGWSFRKNGNNVNTAYDNSGTSWQNISLSVSIELNAGDYVDIISRGGGNIQHDSVNYGMFTGFLLG